MCTIFMDVIDMYEKYMMEALKEAKKAFNQGEIPVGAVLVFEEKIVARSHNTRIQDCCVLGHAEINIFKEISKKKRDWRLIDCTLYITLLPCPMCASAINQSRIRKVVCGTIPNNTNYSLIYQILNDNNYGNSVEIMTGVLEEQCAELLKQFFLKKR